MFKFLVGLPKGFFHTFSLADITGIDNHSLYGRVIQKIFGDGFQGAPIIFPVPETMLCGLGLDKGLNS
jgi:hypothetical protein